MRKTSTAQKEAQGTYRSDREKPVINLEQIDKLHAPKDWPAEAKEIFHEITDIIRKAGYLTKGTTFGIRALAFHEHHRRTLEAKIIKDPGDRKHFEMMDKNSKAVALWCTKLCFNPADVFRRPADTKEPDNGKSLLR